MSEERPEMCPVCHAPEVWCNCVKPCVKCGTPPQVGGSQIVKALCECWDNEYFDFDEWQSLERMR